MKIKPLPARFFFDKIESVREFMKKVQITKYEVKGAFGGCPLALPSFLYRSILYVLCTLSFVLCTLSSVNAGTSSRGSQAMANALRTTQRDRFYLVTQPDIDTACRKRIYECLSDYCGDVTAVPGSRGGRCDYATENDLYNWTLMCLQRDRSPLLPQYKANSKDGKNGMNTATQLCPAYIQSELFSYLSMANMAEQLTFSRSDECIASREQLSAAISCHQIALTYGSGTQNRLVAQLTDFCGDNIPGGSSAMVQRFATAGNLGANILGWAEKIVSMDLSNKGPEWQSAMDQVLAHYTNRMNLTCGDNVKMDTPARNTGAGANNFPTLTTIAGLALDTYGQQELEDIQRAGIANAPEQTIWSEVRSASDLYDYVTATQVVNAGLTNSPLTQNPFLSSAQMSKMQESYQMGTKVFILRDSARCWIIPVRQMTTQEQSAVAQVFASCTSR